MALRIVAILATYNEARFIRACLEHYLRQGIDVYVLDNQSTDETLEIVGEYTNKHVVGVQTIERLGMYQWHKILRCKEELADTLDADWIMHADPDEIRVAPSSHETLAEAISRVDHEGYNAINFMEYTFLPVREFPDHDHADFQRTMRWYYPFGPKHPHRLNAWKKQPRHRPSLRSVIRELRSERRMLPPTADLRSTGGHVVNFPGITPYPIDFKLKHYIVLSLQHAIEKYVQKDFDPKEAENLHGWRASAGAKDFLLPSAASMRDYVSDDLLDPENPLSEHLIVNS